MTADEKLNSKQYDKVLIVASGPSALKYEEYPYKEKGWRIYVVNNAQKALKGWDVWVRSSDYKGSKPGSIEAYQFEFARYNNVARHYGGQREIGYSITVTAGYCALHHAKPKVIGFLGADMNYTPSKDGSTHFYGVGLDFQKQGMSDPDEMVKKHGAKYENYIYHVYMRFFQFAQKVDCSVYNFSFDYNARLPYPFANPEEFEEI